APALKAPTLEDNLRVLTNEIGGRIPGTPAMEKAMHWGFDNFKAAGADKEQYEPIRMPTSSAEGATNVRVIAPFSFPQRAVSLAWTPALTPAKRFRIVSVGYGTPAEFA